MTNKLYEWRESMSYTQMQAAKAFGVDQTTYWRWESAGKLSKLIALAAMAIKDGKNAEDFQRKDVQDDRQT